MKTPAIALISCIALTSTHYAEEEKREIIRPLGIVEGDANPRIQIHPGRMARASQPKMLKDVEVNDTTIQSLLNNEEAKTTIDKLKAAIAIQSLDDALKHLSRASMESIAEKIDFEKEQMLIFAWQGSGQDRIYGHTTSGKEATTRFSYTPGNTKDLKTHVMVYSLPKDMKWTAEKNERVIIRCGVNEVPDIQLKINGKDVQPKIEVK